MMSTAVAQVKAAFGADEAMITYYSQGWDSQDEADTWTYQSTSTSTWHLATLPPTSGSVAFSSIDAASTSSLVLNYGSAQNETATSPEIEILPGSVLEFYSYASAYYLVFGSWTLYAIDGDTQTKLLNQFDWAQENSYDGARWVKYSIDLADYAGKTVKFSFVYTGDYGEDEALDGFQIKQADGSGSAAIEIFEGEQVHFRDMSTGDITYRKWTFAGGDPETSTEVNPVVTYNTAGEYSVALEVGEETGIASNTMMREAYVIVKAQPPVAHIGMPENAYQSPFVAAFVPTDTPVQFRDLSTGNPTAWEWQFTGATPSVSNDQNPIVTYNKKGTYSLMLTASNAKGSSDDAMIYAVQAGGQQYIWNIAPEENSSLSVIELGWYGNYGGTNWLGMDQFAEHYDAPLDMAEISSVAVYFEKTTATSADAPITISIMDADENGMPGNVRASATLKASELAYDANNVVETLFTFDNPVLITDEFFVSIGGFPNDNGDDIAMLLMRRNEGEKSTSYHFLLDEGDNYEYLETGKWFKNEDEAVSLAIAPILSYDITTTAIGNIDAQRTFSAVTWDGSNVIPATGTDAITVHDINGRCVASSRGDKALSLSNLSRGIYIINATCNGKTQAIKIVK